MKLVTPPLPSTPIGPAVHAAPQSTPSQYPRRVLLAVSGLSPQIVTETLYALAAAPAEPFLPTEVHLITTAEGARRAELALLSDDLGWFHRLCTDYHLPGVQFDSSHIHIMRNGAGQAMEDIRTPEDNHAAADAITEWVRHFTNDPQCALHASIAGGRKTMGFYLGYALSLYGRPQDRLSHVLVSDPFESSWEFFYPTPYSRVLQTKDGKLADTALAQVTLAEIPFVSLRHGMTDAFLSGKTSFAASVQAARYSLAPADLTIDLHARTIMASGQTIAIPPAELAFLALFARRVMDGSGPVAAPPKGAPDRDWAQRYLREYRAIVGALADTETTTTALRNGMDGEYFSARKSKLERRLRTALGAAASAYLVSDGGTRPGKYGLTLAPDQVRFSANVALREETR